MLVTLGGLLWPKSKVETDVSLDDDLIENKSQDSPKKKHEIDVSTN